VQVVRQEAEKKLADLRDNISLMLPHELRTPLNGILAYGEILMTEAGTLRADEITEMGQVIHQSGKRLERLVENFLIYAQVELMSADPQKASALCKRQTHDAAKLVEERARHLAQNENRSSDLVLELMDLPLPLSEDYLSKIVDELTHNAFKFSQPGTPVRVELIESHSSVTLAVIDRGRGFSTEHINKIGAYMQFDRKMHEQQGLGLGLVIAKRLTELHGGTLGIQSEPDSETIVSVKFPKTAAEKHSPAIAHAGKAA
jgi:signal transduction histidine kinase